MQVRQFTATGDGPCAYLLACPVERVAVLVHPDPSQAWAYERALAEQELQLLYVLETERVDIREVSRRGRFDSLISDLGLSGNDLTSTPLPADVGLDLDAYRHIRPVRTWAHSDASDANGGEPAGVVVVQVGSRFIELACPARPDLEWFTAGADPQGGIALTFGRARIRVGSFYVELVPLPERPDTIAYRAGDRVFTGAAALAGTSEPPAAATPPSLLSLPPDTIVHPSRTANGVGISTIGLERQRLDELAGVARPRLEPAATPVPAAPRPEGPRGETTLHGYVGLDPEEAWQHLEQLRVVDIRDPRRVADRLPGARSVQMIDLQRTLSGWDRSTPLLLVSESGLRSDKAAALAVRLGFTTVYHLVGGMEMWRDVGLPLRAEALPTALDDLA